jgi:hypothetical protein
MPGLVDLGIQFCEFLNAYSGLNAQKKWKWAFSDDGRSLCTAPEGWQAEDLAGQERCHVMTCIW